MLQVAEASTGMLLIVAVVALLGPFIAGVRLMLRKRQVQRARRSPLSSDLLRPPAHFLRTQADAVRDAIDEALILLIACPLIFYSVYLTQLHILKVRGSVAGLAIVLVAVLASIAWWSRSLLKLATKYDSLRIAIDAETAVGQQLDRLMRDGAFVFHDIPADGFNIDHVVVARSGVFAVETKGRAKPIREKGKEDATVRLDGAVLRFSNGADSKSIAQAEWQAKWLRSWLTSAVGSPVNVHPVLAIPGWFIEPTGSSPVFVFNAKVPKMMLGWKHEALTDELMERIHHQLDQRCRTVKPTYARQAKLHLAA
jgi:hypothetical protein